jgi:hypothetical protein
MIFDHPERIVSWFSDGAGGMFLEFVQSLYNLEVAKLIKATEVSDLYRSQGKILAYAEILGIPTSCRSLIEDKKSGKRA